MNKTIENFLATQWITALVWLCIPAVIVPLIFAIADPPVPERSFAYNSGWIVGGLFDDRGTDKWLHLFFIFLPYIGVQFTRITRWAIRLSDEPPANQVEASNQVESTQSVRTTRMVSSSAQQFTSQTTPTNNDAQAGQTPISAVSEKIIQATVAVSPIGTKWLKFWTYFSLPVGGVLGLLMSLDAPALWIIVVPISTLQFVVAYGLHHRKLWAWKWNWLLIVITYISMAIPTPPPGSNSSGEGLVFQFVIKAVLGGLIWMWPNHVYWKKRRSLFS